jgi:Ca-activated chloride channel homolog
MSENLPPPHDPKFTAYALGELEPEERAAVEAALRDNPAARAAVEEIRATGAQLSAALAAEALQETETKNAAPAAPAAVHATSKSRAHLPPYKQKKFIRFPEFYYIAGLSAAACFAVFVALREPVPHPAKPAAKTYTTIYFPPASPDAEAPTSQRPVALAASSIAAGGVGAASKPDPRLADAAPATEPSAATGDLPPGTAVRGYQVYLDKDANSRMRPILAESSGPGATALANRAGGASPAAGDTSVESSARLSAGENSPKENSFVSVEKTPVSAFPVDVGAASYPNIRRFLESGRLPPAEAVRIEEMLNYFPYAYAAPKEAEALEATLEVASAPWAPTHRLIRIGLAAPPAPEQARAAANLVFLLDLSATMNAPGKLPLVKEAVRELVGKLRPEDRVAIVTYAGGSGLALPSTPAARSGEIIEAIEKLSADGSGGNATGLDLAYDIAKTNFVNGGLNRVVLCSGGDFNLGVGDEATLTRFIAEKAKAGISLAAFGFGMNQVKHPTLEKLAGVGKGDRGYADTLRQAEKLFSEQVGGPQAIAARDVGIQVEFNPGKVASYRLIGYEDPLATNVTLRDGQATRGEVAAGQTITALYEIVLVESGSRPPVAAQAKNAPPRSELLTMTLRYKKPGGLFSRKREFPLVDGGRQFAEASNEFKFAAAVASFGMILRNSPHRGNATLTDIVEWIPRTDRASAASRRGEFVALVNVARQLMR